MLGPLSEPTYAPVDKAESKATGVFGRMNLVSRRMLVTQAWLWWSETSRPRAKDVKRREGNDERKIASRRYLNLEESSESALNRRRTSQSQNTEQIVSPN